MKENKPAIYALNRQGAELAARILSFMPGRLFVAASATLPASFKADPSTGREDISPERFERLADLAASTFHEHPAHVFITACGIAVRTIAPLLVSKAVDPAVVALDQKGEYVISLLGGHQGGANKLAEKIAAGINACPIVTTASDCLGLPPLDVLASEAGLKTADHVGLRKVMAAMIDGLRVTLVDPDNLLDPGGGHGPGSFDRRAELPKPENGDSPGSSPVIYVGIDAPAGRANLAWLIPPVLHVGIGCKRKTTAAAICEAIENVFAANSLPVPGIRALCSIDAKCDEGGIIEAAKHFKASLNFFPPEKLAKMPVTSPSPKALERFNVPGVAEPCALASAGKNARLIVPKQTFPGITIAVARS